MQEPDPDNLSATWGPWSPRCSTPRAWRAVEGFDFTDITYHRAVDPGTVRIAFNRPEVRNAFRPHTVDELYRALDHARMTQRRRAACCSPATARRRRTAAGRSAPAATSGSVAGTATGTPRARRPRRIDPARAGPAAHPGGAAADPVHAQGRHLRGARAGRPAAATACTWCATSRWPAREHARFKQTDADVASFDGGFGSAYLARQVGQKFAREIFFLGRRPTRADDAHRMGMVNAVVPHADLEHDRAGVGAQDQRQEPDRAADAEVRVQPDRRRPGRPAGVRRRGDPAGLHDRRGRRGPDAFLEKRDPDWSRFPYYY